MASLAMNRPRPRPPGLRGLASEPRLSGSKSPVTAAGLIASARFETSTSAPPPSGADASWRTSRTSIGASAVTTTAGLVWVLAAPNRTIDKYDATTVTQIGSVTVPASARTLSASTDALWVTAAGELLKVIRPEGQ